MLEMGTNIKKNMGEYRVMALWITAGALIGLCLGWFLQSYLGPLLLGMMAGTLAGFLQTRRN